MFEAVGQITIGLIATFLAVFALQIAYETILSFFGYWRFWVCRHRYGGKLIKPFPFLVGAVGRYAVEI